MACSVPTVPAPDREALNLRHGRKSLFFGFSELHVHHNRSKYIRRSVPRYWSLTRLSKSRLVDKFHHHTIDLSWTDHILYSSFFIGLFIILSHRRWLRSILRVYRNLPKKMTLVRVVQLCACGPACSSRAPASTSPPDTAMLSARALVI